MKLKIKKKKEKKRQGAKICSVSFKEWVLICGSKVNYP